MEYVLANYADGTYPEVKIDKDRYYLLKNSKHVLSNALYIEEKYEIFIQNYLDFEQDILRSSAEEMIRRFADYSDFFSSRMRFNKSIVNLLTAARLYVDQLHHHVCACLPQIPNAQNKSKELFTEYYDSYLEYRFMEALRNYVQHRGLAVHIVQFGMARSGQENTMLEYTHNILALKKTLQEDKDFKKSVLKEINEEVDLKLNVRIYVQCISEIHERTREMIQESVEAARRNIETVFSEYGSICNEKIGGVDAIAIKDGELVESYPLILNWDDERLKLIRRNKKLTNMKNRYVTGKTTI